MWLHAAQSFIFFLKEVDKSKILCYSMHRVPMYYCRKGDGFMDIKKELTRGSSALLVLSVLEREDLYGYRIIKEIELRSENVFSFKEGTLYPILHAFEKDGYVESYWEGKEGERRRKYYHLTKKGIKILNENKKEWKTYSEAVGKVIGGALNATV